MKESHPLYATAPIAGTAEFIESASGGNWVPTVINPSKSGGTSNVAMFYGHITVWVVALVLSGVTNFGVSGWLPKTHLMSVNSTYVACGEGETGDTHGCGGDILVAGALGGGASDTTTVIGILGGISSIVGVLLLLGGAATLDAEQFARSKSGTILNVFIQIFTLFGTTSTLFVFSQAAIDTSSGFYWLALFATIFTVYAQVLLYCTSAALDVLALPRAFIPSLGASVQLISALAVSSGDFVPGATDAQKVVAWLIPILTFCSLAIMVALRISTRSGNTSNIGDRPFLRSLILTPFLTSGILSVYKLSFVRSDANPASYVFALFGALLNFTIISLIFSPSGDAYAA